MMSYDYQPVWQQDSTGRIQRRWISKQNFDKRYEPTNNLRPSGLMIYRRKQRRIQPILAEPEGVPQPAAIPIEQQNDIVETTYYMKITYDEKTAPRASPHNYVHIDASITRQFPFNDYDRQVKNMRDILWDKINSWFRYSLASLFQHPYLEHGIRDEVHIGTEIKEPNDRIQILYWHRNSRYMSKVPGWFLN